MPDPISIAILNESTLTSDGDLAPIVAANEEDVNTNLIGPWNLPRVVLRQVPKGDSPPAGWWQQVWLNDSDQGNSLGYHDLTAEGMPMGKVFVRTTQTYRQSPSRVSNHELAEQLVDPWLNRYTPAQSDGREYAVEVGDLLSLDSQGRTGLGGVLLSGLALPAAYFGPGYGTRYDVGGVLASPLPHVLPSAGAYLMWRGGAGYEGAAVVPHFVQPPPIVDDDEFLHIQAIHGSRRHRRIKVALGKQLMRSTVAVR